MNISIAIADLNREYLERLSEVMQQYDELTIHVYTNGQKLKEAMEDKRFDVVLFDPDIAEEKLTFPGIKLPVCLYSDEAQGACKYADFVKVEKYQRVSNIYKEIIREYAEKAGYAADFDYSQNTAVVAVYSPVGGSGKTTVALAVAGQVSSQGKSVLFISAEQLNSSFCVNGKEGDGIVALVQAATDEHVNFELKMKGIVKQGFHGMHYIEGFERLADHDAVSADDMTNVLNKIRRCGAFDVLVVDMDSGLGPVEQAVFELADCIVIVDKAGELSEVKMDLFAEQAFANEHKNKMVRVYNFAEINSKYSTKLDVPAAGVIHNYGNLQLKNMIHDIHKNGEIALDKIIRK